MLKQLKMWKMGILMKSSEPSAVLEKEKEKLQEEPDDGKCCQVFRIVGSFLIAVLVILASQVYFDGESISVKSMEAKSEALVGEIFPSKETSEPEKSTPGLVSKNLDIRSNFTFTTKDFFIFWIHFVKSI